MALYEVTDRAGRVRPEIRLHYVRAWPDQDQGAFLVATEHRGGGLGWTFFPAGTAALDQRRAGMLAYAREGM